MFKVGEYVKITNNMAVFKGDRKVNKILLNEKLIVRAVNGDFIEIARRQEGPILGSINKKFLRKFREEKITPVKEVIKPIIVEEKEDDIEIIIKKEEEATINKILNS